MKTRRLEAFSDGVIAILITIMVLELKVPHGETFDTLMGLWPVFLCYVLSFVYLGIYWNNHHHLLHATREVSGAMLWANLLLAAIAYYILQSLIVRAQGPDSLLRRALGGDWKGKVSPILYVTGIALAFVAPAVSLGIYAGVAAVWLIPDTRIERALEGDGAA